MNEYSPLPNLKLELLNGWLRRAKQHPDAARLVLRGSILTLGLCGEKARTPQDVDYTVSLKSLKVLASSNHQGLRETVCFLCTLCSLIR